jgi:hypothetical protein
MDVSRHELGAFTIGDSRLWSHRLTSVSRRHDGDGGGAFSFSGIG